MSSLNSTGSRIDRESIARDLNLGTTRTPAHRSEARSPVEEIQDPKLKAWYQQCAQWYQTGLRTLQSPAATPQDQIDFLNYLDQMNADLQSYGLPGFSAPATSGANAARLGNVGSSGGAGLENVASTEDRGYVLAYQDKNKILAEKGIKTDISVNEDDLDTRTVELNPPSSKANRHLKDHQLTIPSDAADVSVVEKKDPLNHGSTYLEVTIEMGNGSTRVFKYYKAERDGFKLKIDVPDAAQVDLSALSAMKDKVQVGVIGEETAAAETDAAQAEPVMKPDQKTATTRVWNKQAVVDYEVTQGKEIDQIFADQLNLGLPDRSCFVEVTKKANGQYEIVAYKMNEKGERVELRKIQGDQLKTLNFAKNVTQDNLFFKDETKGETGFKKWSDPTRTSSDPAIQIDGKKADDLVVRNDGIKKSLNPDFPDDTRANREANGVLFYNAKNVTLHTVFNDKYHDIKASETVEIVTNPGDSAVVTSLNGFYVIRVTSPEGKSVGYQVEMSKVGKLIVDGDQVTADLTITEKAKLQIGKTPKAAEWAVMLRGNIPRTDHWEIAGQLADKIAGATRDPSQWGDVINFINSIGPNEGNDVIRQIMTAVFKVAGNVERSNVSAGELAYYKPTADHSNATSLLRLIPPSVREAMKAKVLENGGEIGEYRNVRHYEWDRIRFVDDDGEMGNSEDAANLLAESLM